ncbi:hypothetical protein XELAEV_18037169mg [Xenopus laevis]|uniref:Cadherin domain-containing protein n=1 Tax=Xenopus laevis TaxID=8355 RepID=A0A974H9W7_XENLA|nr:hypothetical protein XELAEV_18037169mg [Xenopus laevis]
MFSDHPNSFWRNSIGCLTFKTVRCPLSSGQQVNITLLDINDNAPQWKDEPYLINLVEMTPPDSDVTMVVAIDPDLAENGTLVYSINPANKFYTLNSTTGKIRTTGVVLDRENPNPEEAEMMRKIVISVTDRGSPPLRATSSATVVVNLLDLNDNDPTFQNLPFTAEILEGTAIEASVFQVVAIDLDEGLNGQVTYRMQVGMPRMDFVINSTSGLITSTAVLDREKTAEYYLRVVASDAGTPSKTSTSTLTVRVLDVNDESPTFFPTIYNVSLLENVPRDYIVARLNCTDADTGLNAELSYFITGGNQDGKFIVGFRDGILRTVVNLDRETVASYTLVLEAIDNGPAGNRKTGTATVSVTVLDINDNKPIFLKSSYEASVPENIPFYGSIIQTHRSYHTNRGFVRFSDHVWGVPTAFVRRRSVVWSGLILTRPIPPEPIANRNRIEQSDYPRYSHAR